MMGDFRFGVRRVAGARGFALVVIAIVALGIGLATAVFTVANALLLRRLPVVEQDRIVVLQGETADRKMDNVPLDIDNVRRFALETRTLERTAWFLYNGAGPATIREGEGDRISRLQRALVSGDYFAVLGTRPALGRALRAEDDRAGAPPVVVLSHRAWLERFGGASDVIGRRIMMVEDGTAYAVVGVMPAGLDFPRGTDAWVAIHAAMPAQTLPLMGFDVIGRLAAPAAPSDARREMTAYFGRHFTSGWMQGVRGVVHQLPNLVLGDTRPAVIAFAAAAGLLLLITCINVANLLLVQGLGRAREMAVRTALGASRGRLVRQLVTEHAILAAGGCVLGIALAVGGVRLFAAFAPASLPRLDEVSVDADMLVAACGITAIATLLFALVPAVLSSRVDTQAAFRSGARHSATRFTRTLGEALVACQIALAVVVLAAAGLIGRSFAKLQTVDLAFEPSHVTVAELTFRAGGDASDGPRQTALVQRLVSALQATPGIEAVSPVVSVPYSTERSWEGIPSLEGQSHEEAARNPMVDIEVVSPSFFATLGLPIVRGRAFSDADRAGAQPVVIVSESIAHRFWPAADPISKRLGGAGGVQTVVGVVPDPRYRDLRQARATMYVPLRQSVFPFPPTTLVVRTRGSTADVVSQLRRAMAETTPQIELASAEPFEQLLAGPLAQPRMNAILLGIFAGAAIVLAAVGLFGVLATLVRQRQRELGVRLALGASAAEVAQLVVRRGLMLASAGVLAGVAAALVVNQSLRALLFDVSPTDAATLGATCVLLLVVALFAAWLPARRATSIEPAIALRAE